MKCPDCDHRLSVTKTYSGKSQAIGSMECRNCGHKLSYSAILNPYDTGSRATLRQFEAVPASPGVLSLQFQPGHGLSEAEAVECGTGLWRIVQDGGLARTARGKFVDGGGYPNRALALLHVAHIILGNPDRFS